MLKNIFVIIIAMVFTGGVLFAAPADQPKTGSYAAGDDGKQQKGAAWSSSRFTVETGAKAACITDNLTGLMWVRSPDSINKEVG